MKEKFHCEGLKQRKKKKINNQGQFIGFDCFIDRGVLDFTLTFFCTKNGHISMPMIFTDFISVLHTPEYLRSLLTKISISQSRESLYHPEE